MKYVQEKYSASEIVEQEEVSRQAALSGAGKIQLTGQIASVCEGVIATGESLLIFRL